jgi:membrane associated rhomboid family serine protease
MMTVPKRTSETRPARPGARGLTWPAVLARPPALAKHPVPPGPPVPERPRLLARPPWLTACVFAVTAAVSAAQFADHAILTGLERTPAGLSGDWWRSFTALFVQDGGLPGTLFNLAFLLVIGSVAEQVFSRRRWLLLYFIPGLAGEFVAYSWQPTGAGNSVAVCGLAGGLILLMLTGAVPPPWAAPPAVLCWLAALAATVGRGGIWAAAAIFAVGIPALPRMRQRGWPVGRIVAVAGLAEAAVLMALANIHGAALAAGVALAAVLVLLIP